MPSSKDFFDSEKKENKECFDILEKFKQLPKEKWIYRNINEEIKDNYNYDENVHKNHYLGPLVESMKNQKYEKN